MNELKGAQFLASLQKRLHESVEVVAADGLEVLKEEVSTPGPEPSKPYQFPHKQLGLLYDDMKAPVVGITVSFQSNAPYSEDLEFGHMEDGYQVAPRPFMRPHKTEMKKTFLKMLAEQMRAKRGQTL